MSSVLGSVSSVLESVSSVLESVIALRLISASVLVCQRRHFVLLFVFNTCAIFSIAKQCNKVGF